MNNGQEPDFKAVAQFSRLYMANVWNKLNSEPSDLSGDERLVANQMLIHENYHEIWENIDDFADHVFDPENEENPFLHISLHVALEKQIRANDPPCVKRAFERLVARGEDPHEAQHAMLCVLVDEMWRVVAERRPFDRRRYCEALDNL